MTSSSYTSYIHGQQAGNFLNWFFLFLAFYAALKVASYRSQSGAANAATSTSMNPATMPPPPPQGQPNYNLNHGYDSHLNYGANGNQQSQNQFGGYQPNQTYGGNHPVRY